MSHRLILLLIVGIDALILFFLTSQVSISSYEAELLYGEVSFLQLIIQASLSLFGNSDFALRLPMIILHILSVLLLYKISQKHVKQFRNRVWMILVFVLLPGVISSALLVDSAGLIIFGLLLFVYIYENYSKNLLFFLLIFYSLIDGGFLYLFFALIFYALYLRKKDLFFISLVSLFISIYFFGTHTGGSPVGHFLDALGVYSAIFTPIIFIYIVYVLYRKYITKEIELLWFVAAVPLVLSLLFSFRQKAEIEDFAPYLLIALPLVTQTFTSSYRVRLKEFRTKYKAIFTISLLFLVFNATVLFFNKELYLFIQNPKKHFAYKMHIAKELSKKLKEKNIECVKTDSKMNNRLKFYGIGVCEENILVNNTNKINTKSNVTLSYKNKLLYQANVTNINNQ